MSKRMGEGCGVVFSGRRLSTPRCQTNLPLPLEHADSLLLTRERKSEKDKKMHCTVAQCSGGNLRPPSLLLMLVEEGRRRDFTGGHGEYLFLWGM